MGYQSDPRPLRPKPSITVAGGANVDISGTPASVLIERDSNPGAVRVSCGGVGRNVAENLVRLDTSTELITALGDDMNGNLIRMHADRLGISLKNSLTVAGASTSSYLCINNERGNMQLAINDMTICAQLTPDYFAGLMPRINEGDLLLIEANLPEETIVYLAEHATIPVLAEAVSVAKAVRLKRILPSLWLLKGNRLEMEVLSGVAIVSPADLDHAADILLASGLKHLFVTLGDEGVYYAGQVETIDPQRKPAIERSQQQTVNPHQGRRFVMPAIKPACLINTTGCGDAFLAAVAWGVSEHFDMEVNARLGLAAASICLESPSAVSEQLTVDLLAARSGLSLAKEEKG